MLFSKADPSSSAAVFSDSERTGATVECGDRLSTVNGPETRTLLGVLFGLVVENLALGVPRDCCIDLRWLIPDLMSGLLAIDLSVTCGMRL